MLPERVGRYEIKAELGRGGMATVYRGYDPRFKREVAIKLLPREFLHNPSFRVRFEREAETIAALEHAAIVPVYDFGEQDGQLFLVMRFMPSGSLSDRLEQGPLSLPQATTILERIVGALDRAHSQNIVHRDLKPDNILFDADGKAYIADFGIAKIVSQGESSFTTTGSIVGTPAYMSPEQARGDKDIDGRSDIYALGVMLFQMLSGRLPYEADTPMSVLMKHLIEPVPHILDTSPGLPPACDAIIRQAMAKEPTERFSTASELVSRLAAIEQDNTAPTADKYTQQTSQPFTTKLTPQRGRNRWIIFGLMIGSLILLLVIGFWRPLVSAKPTFLPDTRVPTSSIETAPAIASPGEVTQELNLPSQTISASSETLRAVAFSPDNTKLASGGEDRIVRIWDLSTGQELLSLEGHTNIVTSLAWSPDGQMLASGSDDQTIRVWYMDSGSLVYAPLQGHSYFVYAIAWSPDGSRLASAGWDRQAIVWDIQNGSIISSIEVGFQISGVAWSPDHTRLAICGTGQVLIIDPQNGSIIQQISGEWGDSVAGVAWSPDGKHITTAGHDTDIHVWQVDNWEKERLFQGHTNTVTRIAFSPDSLKLASTAYDVTVRIWDVATGTELTDAPSIPQSMSSAFSLDWSSDGNYLAAAGSDGIIWVWKMSRFMP